MLTWKKLTLVLVAALASGCMSETDPVDGTSDTSEDSLTTTRTIRYGSSAGTDPGATVNLLAPRVIRTYQPSQLRAAKTASPGTPIHHSAKCDLQALANGSQTVIDALVSEFKEVPDVAGSRATLFHEYDNDAGASATLYRNAWATFLSKVIPAVDAVRSHHLRTVPITTPNPYRSGTMDQWYIAAADEIGTDAYSTDAIKRAEAYAAAKGKPWSLPEYGYSVSTSGTDLQVLDRMKSDHTLYTAFSNPPRMVLWYNGGAINGLATRPKSAAYWKNLTATESR